MDFSQNYIRRILQNKAQEKFLKYKKKYENLEKEVLENIECTCDIKDRETKSTFTPIQARKIYFRI